MLREKADGHLRAEAWKRTVRGAAPRRNGAGAVPSRRQNDIGSSDMKAHQKRKCRAGGRQRSNRVRKYREIVEMRRRISVESADTA
jgi:hypothetical protein